MQILARNIQNRVGFWGSAPDPAGGTSNAPPDLLVIRSFLSSAIAASCLQHLQFPDTHDYMQKNQIFSLPRVRPLDAYSASICFTSNMSHYLKSLKICPAPSPNHMHPPEPDSIHDKWMAPYHARYI